VWTKSDSKRNRRDNAGGNDVAIFSGMKKLRQKSRCAVIIGNTEVNIAAAYRASPLLQIALHRNWNSNFKEDIFLGFSSIPL
jgi:hypothetical protein